MDEADRDYHVARIVSGRSRFRLDGRAYTLAAPSRQARLLAAEVRREVLQEALLAGLRSEAEAVADLARVGAWTAAEQAELDAVPGLLDDHRVSYLDARHRSEERGRLRRVIADLKLRRAALEGRRSAQWHVTREAAVAAAGARFTFGASLLRADGRPYWASPERDWSMPDELLDALMAAAAECRLGEEGVRELARTEPWSSVWQSREHCGGGVFGVAAVDLTEEQRLLLRWSAMYDAIGQAEDGLPDPELADDDAVDGWLVRRRRAREGAGKAPRRVVDGDEVFVMVDTAEDAAAVLALNDAGAMATIRERSRALKEAGTLHHGELPDQRRRIRMEAAQAQSQNMRR